MKKSIFFVILLVAVTLTGCNLNTAIAASNYHKEAENVAYTSEYARTINKLEKAEADFQCLRRVVFYNVRLGENVFVCEGFCHVDIDKDGDVEIVIKTGPQSYYRHYLGQKQDITYFSEQIAASNEVENYHYQVIFNPNLWLPEIKSEVR